MKFQNLKLNYRIPFSQLKLTLAIDVEEDGLNQNNFILFFGFVWLFILKLTIFFKEFISYVFWVAISYLFAQKFSPSLFK